MRRSLTKSRSARIVVEMIFTLLTIPMCLGYIETAFFKPDTESDMRMILGMIFFCLTVATFLRALRLKADGKPKASYVMKLIHAAAFLICCLLPIFVGFKLDTCELPLGAMEQTKLMEQMEEIEEMEQTGQTEQTEPTEPTEPTELTEQTEETEQTELTEPIEEMELGYVGDVRQIIGMIYWVVLFSGRVLSIAQKRKWYKVIWNLLLMALIAYCAIYSMVAAATYVAMFTQAILSLLSIMAVAFARVRLDVLKKIIRKTYAAEIIFGLLMLIVSFSYVLRYTEAGVETFADGLWYCFAIVTTIGFGDITATSIVGRILSVILGVYGIVVVALITSIIVNFYSETKKTDDDDDEEEDAEPEAIEAPEQSDAEGE